MFRNSIEKERVMNRHLDYFFISQFLSTEPLLLMQRASNERDPSSTAPLIHRSYVEQGCSKPERPIRVYSYWGSPSENVGEDGDFVLEEITGSLIGPKANGKWPEDLMRIEG